MRVISLLLMLCAAGCGRTVAQETESAQCHAASELALFERDQPAPPDVKPLPTPAQTCQCNGTKFVNDRSTGKLRRIPCPCGQSCRCIGAAPDTITLRPEVIFWTKRGCAPCRAIKAELDACEAELPFVVVVKDDTVKQPDWLPSWPTLHWSIGFDDWKAFSPSAETPWPGVDGFVALWRKSFPQVASPAQASYGIGAGKFPIRATVQQIKQLLSAKGLALPYGMSVKCPTGGLVASVSQAGQDVLIEFDESALPSVSFNGKVRRAKIGETKGNITIDGLPDVTFEVVQ